VAKSEKTERAQGEQSLAPVIPYDAFCDLHSRLVQVPDDFVPANSSFAHTQNAGDVFADKKILSLGNHQPILPVRSKTGLIWM
jgi:hypothetical protein